jgi:hypothetical protein
MATAQTTINREWIANQFSKGIDHEQELRDDARARVDSPPDPALGVLYNLIAREDERHRSIVETIAIRYGHTPSRSVAGGIGETLGRLKDKVSDLSTTGLQRISRDLAAKANAVHWYTAWTQAFESIGDTQSARELAAVASEEKAHRDALQEALNRMVAQGAHGDEPK